MSKPDWVKELGQDDNESLGIIWLEGDKDRKEEWCIAFQDKDGEIVGGALEDGFSSEREAMDYLNKLGLQGYY